jgi:tetratricopeptide (TPR) repeat protein
MLRWRQSTMAGKRTGVQYDVTRLEGLDNDAARTLVAAAHAADCGRIGEAEAGLKPVWARYPRHPEVLRVLAGLFSARGAHRNALAAIRQAVAQRPRDALCRNTLGMVLGAAGDFDGAADALQEACRLDPATAVAWYNLGVVLTHCVRNQEAIDALQQALRLAPDHLDARALLADLRRMQGQTQEAAADYRRILAAHPHAGMAWWGLADLHVGAFDADDVARMRSLLAESRTAPDDRIAIGFALANALEQQGRYSESFNVLADAARRASQRRRWNASGFSAFVRRVNRAFDPAPAPADDATLGRGVIFIVGLPRSGSTLVEQILASHSAVHGTGELPDLPLVIAEESRARGKGFPEWVPDMQPADWARLGRRYLQRTARWRQGHAGFTDKLPGNWVYAGAIRAMLPAATLVACRRDPVETCLSCFRQYLPNNEYTNALGDLAAYWHAFDETVAQYATMHPGKVHQHVYESLVAHPRDAIAGLLDACGLEFEPACLAFHATDRPVRSPSAAQVRTPIRSDTARAANYGDLLDPLRQALAAAGGAGGEGSDSPDTAWTSGQA